MRSGSTLRLIVSLLVLVGVTALVATRIIDGSRSRAAVPAAATKIDVTPRPVPAAPAAPATPALPADPGPLPALLADPARLPCFGAASEDPGRPCVNPRLRGTVYPTPTDARGAQRYDRCRRRFDRDLLRICFWGATQGTATRTIAILGDSHASHWRAAMQTVVAAKRWRAISISRAACPLTLAHPDLPGTARQAGCVAWNQQVQAYVRAHPSITAVFVGAHRGRVIPPPGQTMGAARRAGYLTAWRRLRAGAVRHVVVFRDTPRVRGATLRCVDGALAAGRPAGIACALPRAYALPPDPEALAAASDPAHVQVADLASAFCDARLCRPVIGGALVLRDVSHMTTTFSATLGPRLLRTVNRLTAGWRDGRVPG
ncbi:MAG: acyltransferase, partial [Solirubrobacterales bacterium]|nr:acyltransferase [Solirubrobacterales bacterium]